MCTGRSWEGTATPRRGRTSSRPSSGLRRFRCVEGGLQGGERLRKAQRLGVLVYDALGSQRLLNVLVDEHHYGAIWGGVPLIACDVFEHAYYTRTVPVARSTSTIFLAGLHWGRINERCKKYCK